MDKLLHVTKSIRPYILVGFIYIVFSISMDLSKHMEWAINNIQTIGILLIFLLGLFFVWYGKHKKSINTWSLFGLIVSLYCGLLISNINFVETGTKENYRNLTGGCILSNLKESTSETAGVVEKQFDFPVHYRLWTPGVMNQQDKNTCVAYALSVMKTIQDYYDTNTIIHYSTSYIYLFRRENQFKGEGLRVNEALDNIKENGVAPYEYMPDNLNYSEAQIIKNVQQKNIKLFEEGRKHTINNYQFAGDTKAIKQSLLNHSPVPIVIKVYESFYQTGADGIVQIPQPQIENANDTHCMLIIGWTVINDTEYWVVQNSWGEEWGDGGFCYLDIVNFPLIEKYIVFDTIDYHFNISDINGRWSEDDIKRCIKAGLIKGYDDGTFKPSKNVTREELTSILSELLKRIN